MKDKQHPNAKPSRLMKKASQPLAKHKQQIQAEHGCV